MFAVTGATGQLGRLVIAALLQQVPPSEIIAAVRNPAKAADLSAQGIVVREADYDRPETLASAFAGATKVLLISSSEIGRRGPQHRAAIHAAKAAGVALLAYTSVLHADRSALVIAEDHKETEAALQASGVPHVVLRNGWYNENYNGTIAPALAHGVVIGSSGAGRISAAARADYAAAAAAVLTSPEPQAGKIYELAGDESFTKADLAAELARLTGKPIAYQELPEEAYAQALAGAGLPEAFAALLAQTDTATAQGALFDDSHTLSRLIGRRTIPLSRTLAAALPA